MQELISRLQELIAIATAKNKELESLIEKNKATFSQHEYQAKVIDEAKRDLAKREATVVVVEDIYSMQEKAKALRGKAEQEMEALNKEKEAFSRLSEQKTAEIIDAEKANIAEAKRLKDKEKSLDDGLTKLNEDKAKVKKAMADLGIK